MVSVNINTSRFISVSHVWSALSKGLTEKFENKFGISGFHLHGNGRTEFNEESNNMMSDLKGLVGDIKTTDGFYSAPISQEELRMAFVMLRDKYAL